MDWIDRLNNALDYIENNLEEDIDYKRQPLWMKNLHTYGCSI
ncbi:hypothetical protein [Paucisalibacillus globulus]